MAFIVALFLVPLIILAAWKPETFKYTVGLIIPMTYISYICIRTTHKEFIGLIGLKVLRTIYFLCLVCGAFVYFIGDGALSAGWFISAVSLLAFEPLLSPLWAVLGILSVFGN